MSIEWETHLHTGYRLHHKIDERRNGVNCLTNGICQTRNSSRPPIHFHRAKKDPLISASPPFLSGSLPDAPSGPPMSSAPDTIAAPANPPPTSPTRIRPNHSHSYSTSDLTEEVFRNHPAIIVYIRRFSTFSS